MRLRNTNQLGTETCPLGKHPRVDAGN